MFLFSAALVAAGAAPPAAGASTRPVAYSDYDGWNAIRTPKLSDDGAFLAYSLAPEDGDPTLVVRNLGTGAEMTEPRGSAPQFTADGKFAIYTIGAPKKELDAARRAKKPEDQQPKNGLGILELATGKAVTFERVKSVRVARTGGRYIAFLHEPPPRPPAAPAQASAAPFAGATALAVATGEPGPAVSPPPAPGASASPSPSPSPAPKADKKKDDGAALVIRDLETGANVTVNDVTDYALTDDDRTVAYATQTRDGKGDGLHLRDLAAARASDVLTGAGRYKNIAASRNGAALGFLCDVRTYAQDVPHYDVYVVDLRAATPAAKLAVSETSPGLPRGAAPNENGKLTFSKDGARLYVGTAAAPTPLPSGTPPATAVDLWTYKDLRLQSVQAHDAASDRKRTNAGVYNVDAGRYVQLGTSALRAVLTNDNAQTALGLDDRAYAIAESWLGERYVDVYALSLANGARQLLARNLPEPELSPDGAYAVAWDRALRRWISLRAADGKRTVLAAAPKVTFHDETDDHPGNPPPYGLGGFIAGTRTVIVYDRFDPWLVDLDTGAARNLTHGAGRAAGVVYSVMNLDPDREPLAAGAPFLLSLSDQRTYASGYATVPAGGGVPRVLLRADATVNNAFAQFGGVHARIAPPLRARNANRLVFSQETYRRYRDLWSSDMSFAHPVQVTHANPQLANLRWGSEALISYRAKDGTPLRAVLLLPDGFDPHKKYPMLTYFYEKWSDQFHTFYAPAPRYPTLSRYVSNGYVVLLPDIVYKVGHPGASALRCILAAVDAVTKRGYVDERRIGIAGHSWAAYQINYIITQTNRFRAVEAGAAVANMTSAYGGIRLESGNVREGQYEAGQSRIGATPWDRPDLYLENSGLFHIKNVHTPYLTMHNDADGAVPFSQGVEFLTAMRRLGKPAYMFTFNGKDHNLRDTPADREELKYWSVHFDEWFDYWLKGAPRPAWFDGVDYLHRGERNVRPLFGESATPG